MNRSNFSVGALFWAKTARKYGVAPIFDRFQGPETSTSKNIDIQKSLISPRFLQIRQNKWHHRIPHQKIRLPELFKIVCNPYGHDFQFF